MKAAVYYIPGSEDPFYRLGSSFVGYDIRGAKVLSARQPSPSQPYGFHLTISDTLDYPLQDIGSLKAEIGECLGCFKSSSAFVLRRHPGQPIGRMGPNKDVLVLKYVPNPAFLMLHALLVARINPMAADSFFLATAAERGKAGQAKIKKFKSPYILDDFEPHFTIMNPAPEREQDIREIADAFASFTEIRVDSICLVVRPNAGDYWRIEHEFRIR